MIAAVNCAFEGAVAATALGAVVVATGVCMTALSTVGMIVVGIGVGASLIVVVGSTFTRFLLVDVVDDDGAAVDEVEDDDFFLDFVAVVEVLLGSLSFADDGAGGGGASSDRFRFPAVTDDCDCFVSLPVVVGAAAVVVVVVVADVLDFDGLSFFVVEEVLVGDDDGIDGVGVAGVLLGFGAVSPLTWIIFNFPFGFATDDVANGDATGISLLSLLFLEDFGLLDLVVTSAVASPDDFFLLFGFSSLLAATRSASPPNFFLDFFFFSPPPLLLPAVSPVVASPSPGDFFFFLLEVDLAACSSFGSKSSSSPSFFSNK
jgi:hypothetical protein